MFRFAAVISGIVLMGFLMTIPGTPTGAHEGATGVVKERMMAMMSVGKAMKSLAPMMRGKTAYDAGKVRAAAQTIAGHGGTQLLKLFPEGSLQAPTEARPEIWAEWKEFSSLAMQLSDAAQALEQAAGSQGQEAQTAFRDLARTCSSCHKAYRLKK